MGSELCVFERKSERKGNRAIFGMKDSLCVRVRI